MKFLFDDDELHPLIRDVVAEVMTACDWPSGRVALTEVEAADVHLNK